MPLDHITGEGGFAPTATKKRGDGYICMFLKAPSWGKEEEEDFDQEMLRPTGEPLHTSHFDPKTISLPNDAIAVLVLDAETQTPSALCYFNDDDELLTPEAGISIACPDFAEKAIKLSVLGDDPEFTDRPFVRHDGQVAQIMTADQFGADLNEASIGAIYPRAFTRGDLKNGIARQKIEIPAEETPDSALTEVLKHGRGGGPGTVPV